MCLQIEQYSYYTSIYIYDKACLVTCFGLQCLFWPSVTLKKTNIASCQDASAQITNICMIPDVQDILLVSFGITLNHTRTFLLHINTLACVKAEILAHTQEFILLIHCAKLRYRAYDPKN